MQTISRTTLKFLVALLLVAGLFGTGHASAASLPASPCVSSVGAATCELWATTGTTVLAGSSVTIWGYSTSAVTGTATLPGPVLTVTQGDSVTVTLHNGLAETTALLFQGQAMIPDTAGVAAGGTTTYTFLASRAGTFLYEAGILPGKQHQVAMGMYGALVVKPADGTAYGTAGSAYDEETLLVLSEFDTALTTSNAATFDMRNYAPKYFLINGKPYASPFTGDISVTPGNTVLLRYVNAGLQSHAMSTLGIAQKAIATDGHLLDHPHSMVAETIATGQTLDALVDIPATTAIDTRFAIYDANLMLRNNNASAMGGMLTFLKSGSTGIGGGGPDTTGPSVTALSLSPNPTNGTVNVVVNATIDDVASGNSPVSQAEYYIDSTSGTAYPLTGTFGTPTVLVTGTIPVSTLGNPAFASGNHTIYVRGQDSLGNWGSFTSVVLNLDKTGPTTSGLSLTPNPSSGAVSVALSATSSDVTSGNSNVTAAEYWVDAGVHTAMTGAGSASPTRNFTATIPAGLSMGAHVVSVRSQDVFGNWGAAVTINLQVADVVAPTTSGVTAAPNPNNGSKPLSTSVQAVRVTANFSDVATGNSNIVAAEGFLDTVGITGTGFAFIANDGVLNSPAESGYSDIPLAVVGTLTAGSHTIYVHAKDAAGNWGAMSTTILVIDKTRPTVLSINRITATPTNLASVQFLVTFSESVSGGAISNFSLTTQGVNSASIASVTGSGNTRTVTVNTGTNSGGNPHTIRLNMTNGTGITDLAGNTLSGTFPINGQVYTIDKTAPTVSSINRNNTNPTTASSVSFTVTFSETVTGAAISNFTLTTTGTYSVAPSITSVTGSGTTRTVTINTGTNSGAGTHTIRLDLVNSTGVTDTAGNPVSNLPFTGQSYTKN